MITVVRYAASTDLTTLAKLQQELGSKLPSADEPRVQDLIASVSELIRGYCNRAFKRERVIETLPGYGTPSMFLDRIPLQEIFSVLLNGEAVADYSIADRRSGAVHRKRGWQWTARQQGWLSCAPIGGSESADFSFDYIGDYLLPGDDYAASTISAEAATKKLIDSTGNLPILAAGDRIKVTGFQDQSNNKTFTVVSATEGEIVVDGVLVDEAAGQEIGLAVRNLPADVELAAIEAVKALYFQRFTMAPSENIKQKTVGDLSISYGEQIQPSGLPLITERILAQNYVRLAHA